MIDISLKKHIEVGKILKENELLIYELINLSNLTKESTRQAIRIQNKLSDVKGLLDELLFEEHRKLNTSDGVSIYYNNSRMKSIQLKQRGC